MVWQWHQMDHMQIICTSLQTDNHASTSPLSFYSPDALHATQQQRQITEGTDHIQLKVIYSFLVLPKLKAVVANAKSGLKRPEMWCSLPFILICVTVIGYSELYSVCVCVCVRACVRACACGITEAVRRNHATAKSSCAEVEHHIKEWLKFAAERDGGRRQRDRRSRASAPLPAADPPSDYEQNVSE